MEYTFIVSDFKPLIKELITQMGIAEENVIPFQSFDKENVCHDWIAQLFKDHEIRKLIVPLSLSSDSADMRNNAMGLKIALHIRLNYELKEDQRLIPIILLSDFNLNTILSKTNFDVDSNPQYLFFTNGIYLSQFDATEIQDKTLDAIPCSTEKYKDALLRLKISPKASEGKHSIANAWGCYKLAQAVGYAENILNHEDIAEHLKTLYAKYLICQNNVKVKTKKDKTNIFVNISSNQKRILFIDDQENEGWADLMRFIFKDADFVTVDSTKYKNRETKQFHDFDGFYAECRSHIGKEWDLVIIDLRLNPEKEDIDTEMLAPTDFSGYRLIDDFLRYNKGYQIIVSTASNKIWNVNAALKCGAKSYYIKESPEFNYSKQETYAQYGNFAQEVKKCFERKYLFNLYNLITELQADNCFKSSKKEAEKEFCDTVFCKNGTLEQIWNLLLLDDEKDELLNQCLILCFHILESYCNLQTVSSFGYIESQRKLTAGSVFDKNNNNVDVFTSQPSDKITTLFELEYGKFPFQTNKDNTVISVKYFNSRQLISSYKAGLDISSLVKIISVLKYRDSASDEDIKRILKLRYYRSNVAAHNTGNIDMKKYKISKNEIEFFLKVLKKVFEMNCIK